MRVPTPLPLAAALAAALPLSAQAGAWTAEPGATFFSQSRSFDTWGEPRARLDSYLEHGWREGVTVGGGMSRREGVGGAELTRAAAFVRQRVWQGASGEVASVEFEAAGDAGSGLESAMRLRLGRGFALGSGGGFAEAELGYVSALGGGDGRAQMGATLGARPAAGWLAMARGAIETGDSRRLNAEASLVREISPRASLSFTMGAEDWSAGGPGGAHLRIGIWRRF
ncbi:hypothetical protein [Oceanicella actignis]|uniref:hypothetical protein n=1 Tax=Oceanicella actignis TaxID=1189325 RepID=UPI0011E86D35|nr:hypothetical protein [Oceanicella actignis]TYO89474.1 hypothetical protein LY05_01462 [Oceanicella actignis]